MQYIYLEAHIIDEYRDEGIYYVRRMKWSICGANNMAKLLYRRENDELIETIDRYTDDFVMTMEMQKIVKGLTAAKVPK